MRAIFQLTMVPTVMSGEPEYPVHEEDHIAFLELGFRHESLGSLLEAHGEPHSRHAANYATYMRQHV